MSDRKCLSIQEEEILMEQLRTCPCRTRNATSTEMAGVKFQQNWISYKTYTNVGMNNSVIAVHLQWQRIEELRQVFLPQKYTF